MSETNYKEFAVDILALASVLDRSWELYQRILPEGMEPSKEDEAGAKISQQIAKTIYKLAKARGIV